MNTTIVTYFSKFGWYQSLVELCSELVETYLVETADEIKPSWLKGRRRVGITSGASTDEQTINEVLKRLKTLAQS